MSKLELKDLVNVFMLGMQNSYPRKQTRVFKGVNSYEAYTAAFSKPQDIDRLYTFLNSTQHLISTWCHMPQVELSSRVSIYSYMNI